MKQIPAKLSELAKNAPTAALAFWLSLPLALAQVNENASQNSNRPQSLTNSPIRKLTEAQQNDFLQTLKQRLDDVKAIRAGFVQERHMQAFMDVLIAHGVMYFVKPDKVRWEIKHPYHSALIYNAGDVRKTIYDGESKQVLGGHAKDAMAKVLGFISLWMSGNFDASDEFFATQVFTTKSVARTVRVKSDESFTMESAHLSGENRGRVRMGESGTYIIRAANTTTYLKNMKHINPSSDAGASSDQAISGMRQSAVNLLRAKSAEEASQQLRSQVNEQIRDIHIIRLTPRDKRLAEIILAIELVVADDLSGIMRVEIRERRGDRIIIAIANDDRNPKLEPALFFAK